VVIADDNPVVRMGLRSLLNVSHAVTVVGDAADGEEAVALVSELEPDVVLLDVRMPVLDGVGVAARIRGRTRILMLTYSDEPEVIRAAFANGAAGYLVHGSFGTEELVSAVVSTAGGASELAPQVAAVVLDPGAAPVAQQPATGRDGGAGLTVREREIMDLVAEGLTNGEIARHCFLSEKTVKNHLNRVFAKLGVRSRAEAVAIWLRPAR
jgi:DNA-binding NarL/FixJ family response regulator